MNITRDQILKIEDKLEQAIQLTIESVNQLQQLKLDIDQPELSIQNNDNSPTTSVDAVDQERFDKLFNEINASATLRSLFDDEDDIDRSVRKYIKDSESKCDASSTCSGKQESERNLKTFDLENDEDFEELSNALAEIYPNVDIKILIP